MLNEHDKQIMLEALESYSEQLELDDLYLEKFSESFNVTQEADELINENRLKQKSINLVITKLIRGKNNG